jgi:hypothetical protein
MYRYEIALWLSDEPLRRTEDLTLDKYHSAIVKDGVEHYNTVSRRSKNHKEIVACRVDNSSGVSEIRITLESEAVLNIPNRALKVYSSYLANGALSELVRHNSLFRGTAEKAESPVQAELTDEDLLTLLIKVVFRNTKQDRALLDAIKDVVKSEYQD